MREVHIDDLWSFRNLRVITLENRFLRLHLLPEAGAKIWQITYKPLDADLLWNSPRSAPASLPSGSRYDDVWSGGWDELFPNDETSTIDGELYPDHGEVWTSQWHYRTFSGDDEVGVHLSLTTPISCIRIDKTITLRRGESRLRFQHCFTNAGNSAFPFLWKLHPAFAVSPQHRIDFPTMQVELEPAFPGTLDGATSPFAWPYARIGSRTVDLRNVPPQTQRQLYFFYGTKMAGNWCAITNTATRLASALTFDPSVFPSCWLFASYGGWRNHNVAVLEPCTGYPLNFEALQKAGRARVLDPGQSLNTSVLFSVQPDVAAVGHVDADGTIHEPAHSPSDAVQSR